MTLVDLVPAGLRAKYIQARVRLQAAIWLWPAIATLVGPALALWLVSVDPPLPFELPFLSADAARSAITTVISAVVAALSLVVTGTIVALQLATGQYSPRLLRDALSDRGIQAVLTMFVLTVSYGLTVVPRLGGDSLPLAAVVVGVVFGFVDVVLLVYFLHKLVERLRLEAIITRVVEGTMGAIEEAAALNSGEATPEVPDEAVAIPARRSGYVQGASLESLAAVGERYGVDIRLRPRIGAFLVAGTDLAFVWRADGGASRVDDHVRDELGSRIDRAMALGVDRTIRSDPSYGIRHLVDIGLRAVSPGINDPTTAVQCIDHTTGLLVALARRPLTDGVVSRGGSTASVDRPDFATQLELAQTQLLHYGGRDPWVVEALSRQLRDLLQVTEDGRLVDLVTDQFATIRDTVDQAEYRPHELRVVEAAFDQIEDLLEGHHATDDETAAG